MRHFSGHFKEKTVLVIGDPILDEYAFGIVERNSPEVPTAPVVLVKREQRLLGGAANVAHNIVALGGRALLLGYLGDDDAGRSMSALLAAAKIKDLSFVSKDRPTVVKQRIFNGPQQIARMDREDLSPLSKSDLRKFKVALGNAPRIVDFVIVSDYAKGMISKESMRMILDRFGGDSILADPKPVHRDLMRGLRAITPNLKEVSAMIGRPLRKHEDIREETRALSMKLSTSIITTMGHDGMMVFDEAADSFHRIPRPHVKAVDVTGAGDVATAACALALASGATLLEAARFANHAASFSVTKPGTATVTLKELKNYGY